MHFCAATLWYELSSVGLSVVRVYYMAKRYRTGKLFTHRPIISHVS